MQNPLDILKKYWGYSEFRPLQEDIINAVLEGKDVLALLPTGGGKSICFQVPGLALDGLTIVVTPLISLMRDQVEQLNKRQIKAAAIYSGMPAREIDIILDNCAYGDIKFLYLSPERLKTELMRQRVLKMNVSLIAIDEAHCISLWGFDFRPPYLQISEFREIAGPEIPMIALTATATEKVINDIVEKLDLQEPGIFSRSFARENISYSVRNELDKQRKLLEVLRKTDGSGIVYVNSRRETRDLAAFLSKNAIKADFYHAGLSAEVRNIKQESWIADETRIIVATNAFGMGIDKPDVRIVVHMEVPSSPEAYYQESGRAGRDGKPSFSVIIYNDNDVSRLKNMVEQSNPGPDYLKRIYQALANHLSVAVGASENASYDFDIAAFCNHFNFEPRAAYLAIKKLENEGFIQLNEAFQNPSRVWILLNRQDLYRFQIENSEYDPLIKALLRLYGGELMNQLSKVSEGRIATSLDTTAAEIQKGLSHLDKMDILDYDMQKDKPQLMFMEQRYDSDNLPLDMKAIKERTSNEFKKVEAMISYVENDQRCRSQILLDYFGEVSYDRCGNCDTCLGQKQKDEIVHRDQYHEQILHILKEGPHYIEELISEIEPESEEELQMIVREMIDQGSIYYNNSWQICIK